VQPEPATALFGRGLGTQGNDGVRPTLTMFESTVSGGFDVGVGLFDSTTTMDRCRVDGVQPVQVDGTFGDGIAVFAGGLLGGATLQLTRSQVDHVARAGLGAFGSTIDLADNLITCSQIDINGEDVNGGTFQVIDRGGNRCGCEQLNECQVVSSDLGAPDPLEPEE
jgi:hypothetical protein